jgi:hypothetical protein
VCALRPGSNRCDGLNGTVGPVNTSARQPVKAPAPWRQLFEQPADDWRPFQPPYWLRSRLSAPDELGRRCGRSGQRLRRP